MILFRCAKRSILPSKAETCSQNLHWSFFRPAKAAETNAKFLWSKFRSTKSQNSINFLGVLFLIFFVQSGRKCFTAAVYFNPTNQLKKLRMGTEEIGTLACCCKIAVIL
ncbi:hypothetical protein DW833_03945 [Anaerobutyricum hallii]|uniref:Uncharacterized protein n=1 Tax=Anaerobutyricum hallii TaxID=39488 RepID=A0A414B877_9FIRM|nr:hypothetical protein DW833_03945 [Anaerobutyricum hallii]